SGADPGHDGRHVHRHVRDLFGPRTGRAADRTPGGRLARLPGRELGFAPVAGRAARAQAADTRAPAERDRPVDVYTVPPGRAVRPVLGAGLHSADHGWRAPVARGSVPSQV